MENTILEDNFKKKGKKYKYQENNFTNLTIYPISSLGISSFHIMFKFKIESKLLPKLMIVKVTEFFPMKFRHFLYC